MDLYLVPDDPEHTVLVSPNGVAHYQMRTKGQPRISVLQCAADCEAESIVAEIEWRRWDSPSMIRSPLLGVSMRLLGRCGTGIFLNAFLFRKGRYSRSRYFIGNDGAEYRWKLEKGVGLVLTQVGTNEMVACYTREHIQDGIFAGEKRALIRIEACSLDIDLIILSFLIFAKKRRDRGGDGTRLTAHDEDPQGDGGFSGAEGGGG